MPAEKPPYIQRLTCPRCSFEWDWMVVNSPAVTYQKVLKEARGVRGKARHDLEEVRRVAKEAIEKEVHRNIGEMEKITATKLEAMRRAHAEAFKAWAGGFHRFVELLTAARDSALTGLETIHAPLVKAMEEGFEDYMEAAVKDLNDALAEEHEKDRKGWGAPDAPQV